MEKHQRTEDALEVKRPPINSTIEDEIRVDTLPEDEPLTNEGSKAELSEEKITKDIT